MKISIGKKLNRWLILKESNAIKNRKAWSCLCECGTKSIIRDDSLKNEKTKSCGCLRRELMSKKNFKHGHTKNRQVSSTFRSWHGMVQRCTNPNSTHYKYYGKKGIRICYRWSNKNKNGFLNFLKDMGERPKNKTLNKINNNRNYCKNNCAWSTSREQARNRSNNINITFNNKTQCTTDWAKETGIKASVINNRLKNGWNPKKALTTPTKIFKNLNKEQQS